MNTTPPVTPEELRALAKEDRDFIKAFSGTSEVMDRLNRSNEVRAWACEQMAAQLEGDGWTVQASDYDRLLDAARGLRAACKERLSPGHYAMLDDECRAIDTILSNTPPPSAPSRDAAVEKVLKLWWDRELESPEGAAAMLELDATHKASPSRAETK